MNDWEQRTTTERFKKRREFGPMIEIDTMYKD